MQVIPGAQITSMLHSMTSGIRTREDPDLKGCILAANIQRWLQTRHSLRNRWWYMASYAANPIANTGVYQIE